MRFSKKVLICLLSTYFIFVVVCVIYQFIAKDGMSEALIVSVSTATTGEAGFLSYLKVQERRAKKEDPNV